MGVFDDHRLSVFVARCAMWLQSLPRCAQTQADSLASCAKAGIGPGGCRLRPAGMKIGTRRHISSADQDAYFFRENVLVTLDMALRAVGTIPFATSSRADSARCNADLRRTLLVLFRRPFPVAVVLAG